MLFTDLQIKSQPRHALRASARRIGARFHLVFLDSVKNEQWKNKAIKSISEAEAVIVYDRQLCEKSENARWEIEKSRELGREIIEVNPKDTVAQVSSKLKPLYNFEREFGLCFKAGTRTDAMELYKLMIESSENLIQRRQKTNAFFITAIGSLLAIAGLMVKAGALRSDTIWLLYAFSVAGLLLCKSWRSLIDNYGKLNKAKFDVILATRTRFGCPNLRC